MLGRRRRSARGGLRHLTARPHAPEQVYLPKGERDQADVLLRRRALLTGYEYNAFFGFRYTFGSIFNNVVNPRFF
jgi:hypothetical protein